MTEISPKHPTLDHGAITLSGGESQRVRLAAQVGPGLVGVLYALNEPFIGLHQCDNDKLFNTLESPRSLGNTLIVVGHNEETIRRADETIGIGPSLGRRGGKATVQGDLDDIVATDDSITADYLSGHKNTDMPESHREGDGELVVRGARQRNLGDLDMPIPLETLTAITGASGSDKSTLMHEVLYKGLVCRVDDDTSADPGEHGAIEGYDDIETVQLIDQSPIGCTPRLNPAMYTGISDYIHELFAETKLSKQRDYEKGRLSFNVKGGRCEVYKEQGSAKIEMNFLSNVYVPYEECSGARYNVEALDVTYKNKTITDILDMEVDEAFDFFETDSQIRHRLQLFHDVGPSCMQLGQSSTTLSGGEAQRVRLAEELGKRQTSDTLYLLDEPTTGLHKGDERKLIEVLQRFVDSSNTMLVVEHKLNLVKNTDHTVDLGPEGGADGGTTVASGTPEEIAADPGFHTGRYFRDHLPGTDEERPRSDYRRSAKVMNDGD